MLHFRHFSSFTRLRNLTQISMQIMILVPILLTVLVYESRRPSPSVSSSSVSLEGVPFSSPSGPAPANLLEAGAPLARHHGKPCGTSKKISLGAPTTTYL